MAIVLGSFLIDRGAMPALAGQELHCISQHKMPHVTQLTVLRPGSFRGLDVIVSRRRKAVWGRTHSYANSTPC